MPYGASRLTIVGSSSVTSTFSFDPFPLAPTEEGLQSTLGGVSREALLPGGQLEIALVAALTAPPGDRKWRVEQVAPGRWRFVAAEA